MKDGETMIKILRPRLTLYYLSVVIVAKIATEVPQKE